MPAPLWLLATTLIAGSAVPALAQQGQIVPGLRGEFGLSGEPSTDAANPTNGAPAATYAPASPGALPDETIDDTSLFGPVANDAELTGAASLNPEPAPRLSQRNASEGNRSATNATPPADTRRRTTQANAAGEPADTQTDPTITGGTRVEPARRNAPFQDEPNTRAEPVQSHTVPGEDDPYAPLGLRVGTFILRPTLEQGLATSSNMELSPEGKSGVLSETTLRLNAVSDWSRHSATLDGYGTFRRALSGSDYEDARGRVDATFTYDISDDMRAIATAGYERAPETASSPTVIEGTASEPWLQTFSGSLGLEKEQGKARFALTGRVEHDDYSDAKLEDGTILSQKDRNSTLATVVLRTGYEISPAITPFVEAELGRREYQEGEDAAGYRRSSNRFGFRGGFELDLNEKLVGEISGGYIREEFVDERLAPIEGPTIAAALRWSPERETNVAIEATTTVEGATGAGESGSMLHMGRIAVERRIRSNLTGTAGVGLGWRNYSGTQDHDLLFDAEIGATWWLNRYAGITGRFRHERLDSNLQNRNYDANTVFLGLRLQR